VWVHLSLKALYNQQINQETILSILSMLQRRPCTAQQITEVFGMHLNEVTKYLGKLMRTNRIRADRKGTKMYYTIGRTEKDF